MRTEQISSHFHFQQLFKLPVTQTLCGKVCHIYSKPVIYPGLYTSWLSLKIDTSAVVNKYLFCHKNYMFLSDNNTSAHKLSHMLCFCFNLSAVSSVKMTSCMELHEENPHSTAPSLVLRTWLPFRF